jgi:hypothetical protein
MDVSAIAVGTDFVEQVERAISNADVSLIVIGPGWLGATDAEGRRRLDDPGDHVRSEVRSALASPHPVVPVLVGDASLPTEDQLPDDLKALARRQAVELRDESWSEDVEGLVRRLEGKEPVKERLRWVPAAIGVAVLGVAGTLWWLAQSDGGGEEVDLPPCAAPDETWTAVDAGLDATGVEQLERERTLRYTVLRTDFRKQSDEEWLVVLDVELENESEDVEGNDDHTGYGPNVFDFLYVDKRNVGGPDCFRVASGDNDLAPGEAATAQVGFMSSIDPTDVVMELEADGPTVIEITTGA